MSSPPANPHLPTTSGHVTFVRPLALSCLVVSALCLLYFLCQAGVLLVLSNTTRWKAMALFSEYLDWPVSVQWLLRHPIQVSLYLAAACIPALLICWGLYREQRWGLWGFVALLMITALANFGLTWWLNGVLDHMINLQIETMFRRGMHTQRQLVTLTLLGGSIMLLGLHGWLAWRLLRPDVRARF